MTDDRAKSTSGKMIRSVHVTTCGNSVHCSCVGGLKEVNGGYTSGDT
jgi:hypothetical protein